MSLGKIISAIVMIAALLALTYMAVFSYSESIRLLEESKNAPLFERLEYWFKSAAYMVVFAVIALLIMLLICVIVYIVLKNAAWCQI